MDISRFDFQTDGKYPLMDGKLLRVLRRPFPYTHDTIDSMINPQAYAGGHLPYGFCVTDSGDTFQVNNYSGTSEGLAHGDWTNLGAGKSYIPVARHEELNAVRTAAAFSFGVGTKWAGTYTPGVDKLYIQVKDIDLSFETGNAAGAYWNGGLGWEPISTFTGVYDGGGRHTSSLRSIRPGMYYCGMFGLANGAICKNINIINIYGICERYTGAIIGRDTGVCKVIDCATSGFMYASDAYASGIVSRSSGGGQITGCVSSVSSIGINNHAAGVLGRAGAAATVKDCHAVGYVFSNHGTWKGGLVGREDNVTVINSYYNTLTTAQSDTGKGVPKTTAELIQGKPSADIFTDWDTRIWEFRKGFYPIHKFFGLMPINYPPPTNLAIADVGGGDWQATWDAPNITPLGYYLYVSKDNGAWERVENAITEPTSLTFTAPVVAGTYRYFVTAVYYDKLRRINGETGNSVTVTETVV